MNVPVLRSKSTRKSQFPRPAYLHHSTTIISSPNDSNICCNDSEDNADPTDPTVKTTTSDRFGATFPRYLSHKEEAVEEAMDLSTANSKCQPLTPPMLMPSSSHSSLSTSNHHPNRHVLEDFWTSSVSKKFNNNKKHFI